MPRTPAPPTDEELVAALTKILDGVPRPLKGTPANGAIFTGTKKDVLATAAQSQQFVEETPAPAAAWGITRTTRARNPVIYARISPIGREWVLAKGNPLTIAEGLRDTLTDQGAQLIASVAETYVRLAEIGRTFAVAQQTFKDEMDRYQQATIALRLVLDQARRGGTAEPNWLEDAVNIVVGRKAQHSTARPTLPQLFEELKKTHPTLTLAQFHDGLRTLHTQRRILLGAYTLALATLPDHLNALYLDKEVKYYVDLP